MCNESQSRLEQLFRSQDHIFRFRFGSRNKPPKFSRAHFQIQSIGTVANDVAKHITHKIMEPIVTAIIGGSAGSILTICFTWGRETYKANADIKRKRKAFLDTINPLIADFKSYVPAHSHAPWKTFDAVRDRLIDLAKLVLEDLPNDRRAIFGVAIHKCERIDEQALRHECTARHGVDHTDAIARVLPVFVELRDCIPSA